MRIFINPKITKKINFPQVKVFSHTKKKNTAHATSPPLPRQLHTKLPYTPAAITLSGHKNQLIL